MSVVRRPDHLLSLDDWHGLTENDELRWAELVEGVLQVSPSPTVRHQRAQFALMKQLDQALRGSGLAVVSDIDVVLTETFPPTVRRPDVVVVPDDAVHGSPVRFVAGDVRLAVEITSPGTVRIDRDLKPLDYAQAGIPAYWIIELAGPVTLDAFGLSDGRYEPVLHTGTGTVRVEEPVAFALDLDVLSR